jgi:glycosyltransferase involved in cell wall biosynthesis
MTSSAFEMSDSDNVVGDENESKVKFDSGNVKKVAILLCTYQGERFLAPQLDSFQAQTHTNWEVWASDDGSIDDTHAILKDYQRKWPAGRLSIHNGPAEGFAANFLSLTCKAAVEADFYAYSDQDDTKPPSFANALMQNIGGGNTMVFNNAARELLRETCEYSPVVTHDWWAYILVTACGGKVFYDSYPSVRYRQHDGNVLGMNANWAARFKRMVMLLQGHFKNWNDANVDGLFKLQHKLTPENLKTLKRFSEARQMSLIMRLINLHRIGLYRQTLFGNLGLIVAGFFGKI